MERSTKAAWLEGPGDLRQEDVLDVPVPGQSIRVRGLPAAYSNQAVSEALELFTTSDGEQKSRINQARMEVLQFAHGCVEPSFDVNESEQIAQRFGPAFKKVIAKIDELSGVDKETIEKTNATFPAGGQEPSGNGATQPPAIAAGSR